MKKYIYGAMILLAGLTACTNDMEFKDAKVTAVNELYEPVSGKAVTLAASSTASTYFAWEPCLTEDSGSPLYEVVFYKPGETDPIYRIAADGNGFHSYATILHKDLNRVCKAAGFSQGNSGTVEWTVSSSRGLNEKLSSERWSLKLTSIEGLEEIPSALFITGAATEGGTDVSKAMEFASLGDGEYEIFCRLESGKEYYFVDNKTNSDPNRYYLEGLKIREGSGTSTVSESGVYRIVCDVNSASVTMTLVKTMGYYFSPTNKIEFLLPYVGNGMFQGHGVVNFSRESWGRDQRYKLCMQLGDDSWIWWGTKNTTDSNPNGLPMTDPYYYIQDKGAMYDSSGDPISRWDDKWKFDNEFDGADTQITAIFNVANYTHHVEHYQ